MSPPEEGHSVQYEGSVMRSPCTRTSRSIVFSSSVSVDCLLLTMVLLAGDAQARRAANRAESQPRQLGMDVRTLAENEPRQVRGSSRHQLRTVQPRIARPQTAAQPPEPLIAVVALDRQRITVYSASGQILEAGVSSGQTGFRTPTGVFTVLQRNRHHESNIYSNAPMPYMQRLTWSGIALHEGHLPGYPASHGCIRLSSGTASQLWSIGRIGMRVIVTPFDVSPQSIESAKLPVPRMTALTVNDLPHVVRTAAAGGEEDGERLLDPFQLAQARRIKAAAEREAAERAVRPAFEEATVRSADANRAAEQLRRLADHLARAEEEHEDKREDVVRDQTLSESDAMHIVEAARQRHESLQLEYEAAKAAEAKLADAAFAAARVARDAEIAITEAAEAQKIASFGVEPVSIFVSRREGRVFVRQGFNPLHDEPISIVEPERPFGTHVFTATQSLDGGAQLRWSAVTVPDSFGATDEATAKGSRRRAVAEQAPLLSSSAAEVLERIELPQATLQIIGDRLWPGASLIISDHGLGTETGKGTDFIVLTK